jgi:hypothetical protein
MPQLETYDITSWMPDREHGQAYPEGAREKKVVISPENADTSIFKSQWRYLYKLSSHRYPEQFWAEVIAYNIAKNLGINVPKAYAAYDNTTGTCGALIEWFYGPNESFVAAGNFFQRIIPLFDRDKGKQHNIKDSLAIVGAILDNKFSAQEEFYTMLLFDSLIGNTDRHQDNWGFTVTPIGLEEVQWGFSPWFDNGTSLAHELSLKKVSQWGKDPYFNYVNRGQHHLRKSRHEDVQMKHLDSMRFVADRSPELASRFSKMLENFSLDGLKWCLEHYVNLPIPEIGRLSNERAELIFKITSLRHEMLREKLT